MAGILREGPESTARCAALGGHPPGQIRNTYPKWHTYTTIHSYIHTYIYIYIHICIYIHIYICVYDYCICKYLYIHTYVYTYLFDCLLVDLFLCVQMRMCRKKYIADKHTNTYLDMLCFLTF